MLYHVERRQESIYVKEDAFPLKNNAIVVAHAALHF